MKSRTQARRLAALEGLISAEVGEALYELALAVPEGQNIVEIGAYKGKSTCYLAEGARDAGAGAQVHSVDLWDTAGNPSGRHGYAEPGVIDAWRAQVASQKLTGRVTAHKASGVNYAAIYHGKPVGLLYIDGSHEYEDVRADFEAWAGHLAPGAVVAFDDYGTAPNPGVERFVHELVAGEDFGGTWTRGPEPLVWLRWRAEAPELGS